MLISLTWLQDYIEIPPAIDSRELAEKFTVTTAEVEQIERIDISAQGLIAARVISAKELSHSRNLKLVELDVGGGKTVQTVTAAPVIHEGSNVVYAPPGASVASMPKIDRASVADVESCGIILPGEALGIEMAAQEAVFLDETFSSGALLPSDLFDDWIIEVDNKSITHRPDLWGHYGIAREMAAILRVPLKTYPVVPIEDLMTPDLPELPISIGDSSACRRYSGLVVEGVPTKPAPLWMQLRLGHVGMRPISGLVDLTNYIMADLGQPMHAFDASAADQIDVGWAKPDEKFRTLDGMERTLHSDSLMIQCQGKSVAIAGIMGGLESEVSETTVSLLLESANFDPSTIRRTAGKLGMRTDASARFEKSLDPTNTALAIQRFIVLGRDMYPELTCKSRFSDCYPGAVKPTTVSVNPAHVARTIGRNVSLQEANDLLKPLAMDVSAIGDQWSVAVPSFRATNDISIEADVIEELARTIGFGTVQPAMPRVSMRQFEKNGLHELERQSLAYFTTAHSYHEIHGYIWYDANWFRKHDVDPGQCVELKNPAAEGLQYLRRSLMPGLLAATARNRFYFPEICLIETGSVFTRKQSDDNEVRHVGLVRARRGKKAETAVFEELKGAIAGWAWDRFAKQVAYRPAKANKHHPWEHAQRTAELTIDGDSYGTLSVVDASFRRRMDEHLASWAIAWAELDLSKASKLARHNEKLDTIPANPLVELDFSFLVPSASLYEKVVANASGFEHPLLRRLCYVGSYEGDSVGAGQRSITLRALIGEASRTLLDEDAAAFSKEFEKHLVEFGYHIRR